MSELRLWLNDIRETPAGIVAIENYCNYFGIDENDLMKNLAGLNDSQLEFVVLLVKGAYELNTHERREIKKSNRECVFPCSHIV